MKIVFLLTQDLESPSGLGRYLPLAKELSRRGYGVKVLALHPDFESLDQKKFVVNGFEVDYVAPMHVKKRLNSKTYYSGFKLLGITFKATWALFNGASGSSPDLIYLGKPHPMNGIAGYFASRLLGKPLYLDCDDDEAGSSVFQASWQRQVVIFFERWLPQKAAVISSNTYQTLDRLRAIVGNDKKMVYLPNGVDRERFQNAGDISVGNLSEKLNLKNTKVILYVGSMGLLHHQVDILIAAFKLIQADYPEARLLLVGGGEDYDKLIKQAQLMGSTKEIIFIGRVSSHEVVSYYRLAAVSVDPVADNPAARGRAPLKMFESWAVGTPFITADVGDRRLLAGDPPAALVVQPGDPVDLAQGIKLILKDPELANTLARRGLERVEEFYWDKIASKIDWL
jgi:glycosyltransferase involved in cell wall biosynthesis